MTHPGDDQVGERLRELTTPPSVGDPLARVLARSRRDTRRRTTLSAAASVLAVATLALGVAAIDTGPRPIPPAESGVVPWKARFAPQNALAPPSFETPPGLQPCQADDLSATASPALEVPAREGRTATVEVDLEIVNDGAACQLPAEADGSVRAEDGTELPLSGDVVRAGPEHSPPPPLEKGASASTRLTWSSACADDPGRWSVVLTVGPAQVTAVVPGDDPAVPRCEAPTRGTGSVYGFGVWTVLNELGQPAADPRGALVSTLTAPDTVRMLEPLKMILRLDNPSRGPVSLDPCPELGFSFDNRGPGAFLSAGPAMLLNCPEAPEAIPAGGRVDFALELLMSPALADGFLEPGTWYVSAGGIGRSDDTLRKVTVLPPADPPSTGAASCEWVPAADGEPRTPGLPATSAPRSPATREVVLSTNRGEAVLELDASAAPCAVQSFLHHVEAGYWQDQRCYQLSAFRTFRHLDCGAPNADPDRAGFLFPAEVPPNTTYPEGTVVLASSGPWTHTGAVRVLYGAAPTYGQSFTVLGRLTSGLDLFREVAAGGQKDGDFGGPRLELTIRSVTLRS